MDFLATEHGLPDVLGQGEGSETLHAYCLDTLVPVCGELLAAAARSGEIVRSDIQALAFMRAIGNLCIGAKDDARYDARRMVALPLAGLTTAG
ncbi:hypothetical protein SAMN05216223_101275 [Actinacidiphila yanglinensis]|uniref:Transcriptional regulator SbtR-like C-terminal domain-containing protein n=1 Tax=Actinacidiphila yanglinensis TaxID=310779 RepID=A0A1H5SW39_9ACTN|nr:hypothetical protein SAMN05216223_101275 [Actinacidiphila yanglinensis]